MTHEEATVFSVLTEGKSYQKYPFAVYQLQTKFRDEARPRAGLIRVREFTMKDAYSFHTSQESLDEEYDKYYEAYNKIYRRVGVPSNAKFMKVTILNEAYPTNLSIQLFRLPTHCTFKDLYLENCRAVGMAPQGMNNLLFENCELTNCGSAVTKCALDAEDGWDMMQDVTFRKLHNSFP